MSTYPGALQAEVLILLFSLFFRSLAFTNRSTLWHQAPSKQGPRRKKKKKANTEKSRRNVTTGCVPLPAGPTWTATLSQLTDKRPSPFKDNALRRRTVPWPRSARMCLL